MYYVTILISHVAITNYVYWYNPCVSICLICVQNTVGGGGVQGGDCNFTCSYAYTVNSLMFARDLFEEIRNHF